MDDEKEIHAMKILKASRKSIHDNSQWEVGKWREIPEARTYTSACGPGLHSIICGDPLKSPVFSFPAEVWEDECEEECSRDDVKARYVRQRIVKDVTAEHPIVLRVNKLVADIAKVKWFKPDPKTTAPSYMKIERFDSLAAARAAARDAARAAAGDAARDAARAAAGDAAWAARACIVSDLPVDTTWLWRWWRAWEMGYYPIREDGDILVVGLIQEKD